MDGLSLLCEHYKCAVRDGRVQRMAALCMGMCVFVSAGVYAILEWLMKKAHFHDIEKSHFILFACLSHSYHTAKQIIFPVPSKWEYGGERSGTD